MVHKGKISTTVMTGLGVLGALYADPSVSEKVARSTDSINAEGVSALRQKMGWVLDSEQKSQQDQLFLAGIRQRSTQAIATEFEGKSAEEIERMAKAMGYDVEWQTV